MSKVPLFKNPLSPSVKKAVEDARHEEDLQKMKSRLDDMNIDEKIRKTEPYTKAYSDFISTESPANIAKLKAYWATKNGGKSRKNRRTRKGGRKNRRTRKH